LPRLSRRKLGDEIVGGLGHREPAATSNALIAAQTPIPRDGAKAT
jgi:hypothetical protein